jgi:hypothetical protein
MQVVSSESAEPVEKWGNLSATGSASAVKSRGILHWQSQWHTFSTAC